VSGGCAARLVAPLARAIPVIQARGRDEVEESSQK